jgi:two-component system, NtrC family, response regulator GlrR
MTDHQSTLSVNRVDAATPDRGAIDGTTTAPVTNPPRATGRRRSDRIISASAPMQEVVDQASGIARSDDPVILAGPSGSGRKHVARAIHQWSARAGGPLVELQVAGTSDAVQQRELFGEGSQTGAQPGALARAERGTLLIESADQLSSSVVSRLASNAAGGGQTRILATISFGGPSGVDAPTNGLAALGNAHRIQLSPLASRVEDVLPLAAHFLAEFAAEEALEVIGFSADARRWLVEEPWTGNVRELRERIRQAIRLSGQGAISAESLMLSTEGDEVPSFKDAKRSFETRYVEGLLRRCSGNISRAARMAKKDRKDFYDVIRRTGVNPAQFRG